ncbi:MAG: HEAT repeat domain-containing protein, partial [Planctomycetota bacterium]
MKNGIRRYSFLEVEMRAALLVAIITITGCAGTHEKQTQRRVENWLSRASFGGLFFGRGPGADIDIDRWLAEGKSIPNVAPILCRMLEERDPQADLPLIAFALGHVGSRESVPALIDALGDSDLRTRMAAATSLGRLGDEAAVGPLGRLVASDPDDNVRANAVVALGEIDGPEARKYLERALDDESGFVSDCALSALGRSLSWREISVATALERLGEAAPKPLRMNVTGGDAAETYIGHKRCITIMAFAGDKADVFAIADAFLMGEDDPSSAAVYPFFVYPGSGA